MLFLSMFLISGAFLLVGYRTYGAFMAKAYGISDDNVTPAVRLEDGVDYCPAHPAVLLGHHFASIAGAGPIVGPITAAGIFGWLPTLCWCIIGSTFLGGTHDLGALVASMRHDGKSVGEVIERWIGHSGKTLFLCFTILAMILVVAVFQVLTVNTFVADPVVAFVACLYILLALLSGLMIYRWHLPLWLVTSVMLACIALACLKGGESAWVMETFSLSFNTWNFILAIYIISASVLPVWLMLQPRDYLASYFLYFAVIVGALGMLFGGGLNAGEIPAVKPGIFAFSMTKQSFWPMMFVVVACGAISGFHALIGSGTTSKQLRKESDALLVGYGSMLLEGLVAVISIGTLMVVGMAGASQDPVITFAQGFGKFASLLGMDPQFGTRLGALAVNGFLLTSLDTATRLTRYQIQEFSNMKIGKYTATLIGVCAAVALIYAKTVRPDGTTISAWQTVWPVFGAANQLIAALTLLGLGLWVIKGLKKKATFLMAPFWFMLVTTIMALAIEIKSALSGTYSNYLLAAVSALLMVLAVMMVIEGLRSLKKN